MTPRTLLALLIVLLLVTPAAANVCWIDHVELEGAGVRVIFSDDQGHIFGSIRSKEGAFTVGHKQITWFSGPMKGQSEPGILLMEDEVISLTQGPEDNCTIKFAVAPHGVIAEATLNPPLSGDEPQQVTEFVPAQLPAKH